MSKSIFEENYIEIPLREQIKILFLNELKKIKQFISYKIVLMRLLVFFLLFFNIFIYFYLNEYFNVFIYFILYMIGTFIIGISAFYIFFNPLILRLKIYYNMNYRNIYFNQQELLISRLSDKNIVFVTLTSFSQDNDIQIEKESIVHLIYFKAMNYNLSSFENKYIVLVVTWLIGLFLCTLWFIFIIVDNNSMLSENFLFFYSIVSFSLYSWFVYQYIKFASSFYKIGLNHSQKIKIYDKYFIFDFILNYELIEFSKIYTNSNVLRKNKNYFIYVLLAGVFGIYLPLMYDKIYNVNVNVKSIDSKVVQKIK